MQSCRTGAAVVEVSGGEGSRPREPNRPELTGARRRRPSPRTREWLAPRRTFRGRGFDLLRVDYRAGRLRRPCLCAPTAVLGAVRNVNYAAAIVVMTVIIGPSV